MKGKLLSIAVVAFAAAACSDSAVLELRRPTPAELRPALAADRQFPVVIVRSDHTPPADAGAPIVDNFQDAVARVESGGTIMVFPGTYLSAGVAIEKPLTIRGAGSEMPVVEGVDGFTSFTIRDVASGLVRIDGLRFRNTGHDSFSGIFITGQIDRVEIENSEFYPGTQPVPDPSTDLGYYGGVAPHRVRATAIVIRNNKFIGGNIGVHTNDAVGTMILDNTFTNQDNAAIHDGNGGAMHAEGNTVNGCGPRWCIGVFGGGSVILLRNTINVDFSRPVATAIQVHGGTYRIEGNVITGTGGSRDVANAETWPIRSHAIAVNASASVSGNHVSGAHNGLAFSSATVSGADNVVTSVGSVLHIFLSTVSLHRSDFTDYARAIQFVFEYGSSSIACNWWGNATGPQNVDPWIDPALYTPWATEPIASRPSVTCG